MTSKVTYWLGKNISVRYLLIFFAPFLLFFLPLLTGKGLFWGLPILQFIPWRVLAYDLLGQGILPLWNPYNGLGAPLFANYQSALIYPPGLILYLFYLLGDTPGLVWGFTLLVPVHLGWAGLGMAKLSKEIGLSIRGQVISGLSFGLCAFFVARAGFFSMIWAGVWLPWLILAAEKTIQARNRKTAIWAIARLAFIAAFQLLAGHAQLTWYSFLLAGIWVIYRSWHLSDFKNMGVVVGKFGTGLIIAVLVSMIQLAPTYEYLLESQRSSSVEYANAMTYSFWPWQLLTFIFPGIFGNPGLGDYWGYGAFWEDEVYIGLIPILLALTTLKQLWKKGQPPENLSTYRPILFLWVLALVGGLFALGKNTPLFPWLYHYVPTFDMFQAPTRWMFWVVFSLSLLAGIGADLWKKPFGSGLWWLKLSRVGILGVVIGAIAALLIMPNIQPSFIRTFIYTGIFGFLTINIAIHAPEMTYKSRVKRWEWIGMSVILVDLVAANAFSNIFVEAKVFQRYSDDHRTAEVQQNRIYIPAEIERSLKFDRFFRFSDFSPREDWSNIHDTYLPNLNLFDQVAMINNFDPLTPRRYAVWMAHLDSLTEEQRGQRLKEMSVGFVASTPDMDIPEIRIDPLDPYSRLRWSACGELIRRGQDESQIKAELGSRLENQPRCILVEAANACGQDGPDAMPREIRLIHESVNDLEIVVSDGAEGWLIVADTWYPGWQARIDGNRVPIYPADYLFRGICVPEGNHTILFEYKPKSFFIGMLVSFGAVLLWLGMVVFGKWQN